MTSLKPMYQFQSRRSVVHSTKGIVASSQPLASQIGIKILEQGGNAADAAVAVAAALNLTEPCSTGIGGDMFCLFYDASTKQIKSLNGSGRSPAKSSLEQLKKELATTEGDTDSIPVQSVHSVTVPGAAAGWVDTVERLGSGKLSLAEVLKPVIDLAEDGYVISQISAASWSVGERRIKSASPNYKEILKSDKNAPLGCRAPKEGEIMTNPTLANTFKLLGQHGKAGYYQGSVAEAIIKVTSDKGGHLSLDDLKHHCDAGTENTEPISLEFDGLGVNTERGGLRVWEHPPNGQGIVALMALGILKQLESTGQIKKWTRDQHNTIAHLHPIIEALRLAFADASWFVADPSVEKVPVTSLLSPAYLAERAAQYSADKAIPSSHLRHGSPAHSSSDTVYFTVTDRAGNACSFINSNYEGFGTAIVPAGCGFTLQNRGSNFSLDANHPNAYAPRKRPYHTIIPALATHVDTGDLAMSFGVMGGFMQPQGHVQVLLNVYAFGMDAQAALDAPRVCVGPGMPDEEGRVQGQVVSVEEGIAAETVEGLRKMGHNVQVVDGYGRGMFGKGQVILVSEDDVDGSSSGGKRRVYSAGSDGRGDGAALPLL